MINFKLMFSTKKSALQTAVVAVFC